MKPQGTPTFRDCEAESKVSQKIRGEKLSK